MDIKRINQLARDIESLQNVAAGGISHSNNPSCLILERSKLIEPIFVDARACAEMAAREVYAARIPALIASLEAELKGEICPQLEPDPDAYLEPLTRAFGAHRGLNSDWAVMAWCVAGNFVDGTWLLDDESPSETVSLVTRKDDGSGDPAIATICQGSVEQILPIALSICHAGAV